MDDFNIFPFSGTFLVVQWLRLYIPNTGSMGLIPGWETKIHMPYRQKKNMKYSQSLFVQILTFLNSFYSLI